MTNISGITNINIRASVTFPSGFNVTHFADDADPLDSAAIEFASTSMGANGNLIIWNSPKAIPAALNVIPTSESDRNLDILANANRKGGSRTIANDIITMTITYNDGATKTLSGGAITSAMIINSSTSENRLKSKPYTFMFEDAT